MRIPLALLVVSALWSCSEPYAGGRLRPEVVPKIAEEHPPVGVSQSAGDVAAPNTAPSMPRVATTKVTEAEVLDHVERLGAQHGAAGLRALPPGTTLTDRLRFCTAQILLGRSREVIPELERLANDHAETPLVWRQLGHAYYKADNRDDAERCMRRAYALAAGNRFATSPSLPSFLGRLLIERAKTREDGIRILRNELAEGTDYVRAAWALATHLRERERHTEALACLDSALQRDPQHERLHVAKAKVLLELHQTKAALDILAPLVEKEQADQFAIDSMMRVRILRNEFEEALPLIDRLIALPGLAEVDRVGLQARREGIAEAVKTKFREMVPAWKVEAIVRGHPDLQFRIKILREVMLQENLRLREDCLRISFNSESPILRAEALIALIPHATRPLVNLKAGFEDPDGKVRGTAAILAGGLPTGRDQATALLLEYLGEETDAYAFRQMHSALVKLTGMEFELPFGAVDDPKQRRAIVERWRKGK